ncbi:MAG: hypothetical protein VYE73_12155 [Acidobacteriota bacterium]|nr:hypothetical protein [Acidobacteriota bacterium]
MIEFHDPRAEPGAAPEPYDLGAHVEGLCIGLLANGFPDSERFLDRVETALVDLEPSIEVQRFNKGNASIVAGGELLDGITKECRAVVTAYGH